MIDEQVHDWLNIQSRMLVKAVEQSLIMGYSELVRHDCGVYYVVGQAHVCADVELPHERNRRLRP